MSLSLAATMSLIEDLRHRGEDFCLVTVIRTANATSAKAGAKAVVTRDGGLHGFVGGSCVQGAAIRTALAAMQAGEPRLIRVRPKEERAGDAEGLEVHDSHCPSGGTVDLFLEPMLQRTRIVICGGSPVAAALARIACSMGYETVAAAPSADEARIAEVDRWIEDFDLSAIPLRAQDAVVVATQGRRDREALKAALLSPAGYVGMVGSRAKVRKLLVQLADVPEALKSRLRGPAGLDIGAIDPEEIALSILGEIVRDRRRSERAATPRRVPAPDC
jgi:xanthine dehydrogenase accessory factor